MVTNYLQERNDLNQTVHQMEPFNLVKLESGRYKTPLFSSQAEWQYCCAIQFSFHFLQIVLIFLCGAEMDICQVYIGYCCSSNLQFQPCVRQKKKIFLTVIKYLLFITCRQSIGVQLPWRIWAVRF